MCKVTGCPPEGGVPLMPFTEELMCLVHVRTCPASFSMEQGPESPFLFSEWPDTNTDETEVGNLKYAAVEMIWDLFALVLAAVREKAQVSALWHFPVNPRGFLNGECSVRNWRILRRRTKNEAFSLSVKKKQKLKSKDLLEKTSKLTCS